jgi:hypothetical protein
MQRFGRRPGCGNLAEQGRPIEIYLTAAEEGVAARFIVGLAHLGYCVEKTSFGAHCSQMTFVDTRSPYPKSGILLIRCYGKV